MAVNDPWAVGVAVDEVDPWAVGSVVGETTWSPLESSSTRTTSGSVSPDTPPAGSLPPGPPIVASEVPTPDVPPPDSPEGRYLRGQYEAYRQLYQSPQSIQDASQQYLPARVAMAPMYDIGAALKAFYYDAIVGDSDAANKVKLSRAAQSAALSEFDDDSYVPEFLAGGATRVAGSLGKMTYGAAVGTLAGNPLGGAVAMAAYDSGSSARAMALAEGATEREANITGLANAAIEAGVTLAFSAAGKGGLESVTAGRLSRASLLQAAKQVGPELAEENIISQLQLAVDGVVRDQWASPGEMYKAAKDTTIDTLLAMGLVHEAGRAKVLAFLDNPSRKNAKEIGLGDATTKAEREAHVLGIKAQTIRQQLHALVGRNLQTTEEAEFLFGMLQSRADSAGVSLDKYVEDAGLEIRAANWEEWSAANDGKRDTSLETMAEPAFENLPEPARRSLSETRVVDEAGEPIPVYHRTPADFGAFDVSKAQGGDYVGIYFAAEPSAPTVAPDMGEGTRTIPAYLNLKNPATVADKQRVLEKLGPNWTPQQLTDALKAEGFDGVIDTDYRVTEYVAFDPQQVVNALTGEVMAEQTPAETAPTPKGKKKPARRAQIQFLKSEGRAVITAFEQADLASMVHEMGHLFRRDLAGADLNAAARWAGVKKGRWTKGAEEQFADGFLKWVSEGKGPSPAVTRFFEQFAAYIRGLFDAHRKSRLDPLNISPEMQGVFGRLLGDTSLLRQEAAPQTVTPAPPVAPDAPEATFEINNQIPPEAPSGTPNAIQTPDAVPGPPQPQNAPTSPVDDAARNLALHAVDEATRDLKAFVDEQMGDPERKTWDDAKLAAGQRLAQDPVGRRAYWQARVDAANSTGTPLSLIDMVDTVEVNLIANAYADEGFRTGNAEAIVQHNAFHTAFRNARTEQARSLGYRDPVAGPAERRKRDIQKALATDTPEIAALRKKGKSPDILAEVSEAVVRRYQDLTEKLASIGIDLKDLDGIAADPQKALAVLNAARPAEASWMDMLYEYWRNSILSSPVTHGVNTASNLLFVLENFAERTLEAGINTTIGKTKKTSATMGEIPLLVGELFSKHNWGQAFANAFTAWRNEMPALEESLGREGRVRFDRGSYAIAGDPTKLSGKALNWVGRKIRAIGFRPLLFMDEIAKTMTSHMEAAAMAYRLAKVEAQSNSALDVNARTLELLNDRNSDAWTMAMDKAQTLAFQGERGLVAGVTSKSIDAIRSMPGGRWIVPFRDTPAAVFEEGIRRMPVIGFLLDFAEQRRAGKSIAEIDFAPTLARQAIAMGVLTAIEAWLGDDDEPLITGTRDMVDRNQRDVAYRTFQPMTVRLPGTDVRVSYARLEPIATALAWSVDVVRAYKLGARQGGTPQALANAAGESVTGMVRQITTKTFMDTVGDLMDAVQSSARGEAHQFAEWSAKQAASFVPNFYRSWLRGNDIPQSKIWGKGEAYAAMLLKRTAQQALGNPLGFPPTKRYDVWGRQITYNSADAGALNYLKWFGVKTQTPSSVLDIDRALYVWNVRHPQQATHWSEPDKSFRVGKDHHYLTDEEYEEYSRRAGEYALANASRVKINLDNPTEQQIEAIGKAVTRGRTRARNELKRGWLDRIRNEQPPTPAR